MVVNCAATDNNDYSYYYSHSQTEENNFGKKNKIKSNLSRITSLSLL